MNPVVHSIHVYPIKSLDGVSVTSARLIAGGAIEFDRRWALVDLAGKFVNAKRTALIQQIRSTFHLDERTVDIAQADREPTTFSLDRDLGALAGWLSTSLGIGVGIVENASGGFPDDTDAAGPTVISSATLALVAEWFGFDVDEARRRFRANIEVAGVDPFWEDRLYSADGPRPFRIGSTRFLGINPCARCVVPTRDSQTGNVQEGFASQFRQRREETLPADVARSRFDHFYRLSVNTLGDASAVGQRIEVGNPIAVEPTA